VPFDAARLAAPSSRSFVVSFTTREFTGRRYPRWLWPAVGVTVVLVVVLLIVVLTTGGGGGGESAAVTPPGGSTAEPNPSTGTGGNSSIPAVPNPATTGTRQPSDPQYLTAAPAEVNFQVVHGLQLPFSPVDGPLRVDGPVAAGYSHTPQGAALAAVQLVARLLYAPGYKQVLEQQTVFASPLQSQFLASRDSQQQSSDRDVETAVARTVGFKVDSFRPDQATIEIAFPNVNGAPGTYVTGPDTLIWSGGDWKIADNSNSPSTTVNSLPGYTTW